MARLNAAGALWLLGAVFVPGLVRGEEAVEPSVCVDEELKADLDAKRRRRGVKSRLFQKTNRHELSVRGGGFVSDLFDATWMAGLGYTYHLTEQFAVEATGAYTRFTSAGGPALEDTFQVLEGREQRALLFASNLVYAPVQAKLQSGGSVVHFDLFVTAGAGVVDSVLSSGVAGNVGVGGIFFLGRAVALRIDVRDYVYRQQLLSRRLWVNDVAVTTGLSLLLPVVE